MPFVPGTKTTFSDSADHILDLSDGLDFLNPKNDGIALLKKIGLNGGKAKAVKHEWTTVELAARGETVTLADGVATTLTVADAYIYQIGDLIRCEAEVMRVTALASATTLTVTRGYAGTTGAAHSAKLAYSLGSADIEGADAPAGIQDSGARLYNYVQTFTRGVKLSNDEIAQLSTDGNPLNKQLERRFIEVNRLLARSFFYGVRHEDTSLKIHAMGGLKQFVTTNVTNVAGALTLAAIDAQILNIVNAGGNPDTLVLSPYQSQKLSALDANFQRVGKSEQTGGNLRTMEWQSNLLDTPLQVIIDHSILTDELWILDSERVKIMPLSNNGISGAFHVENSTTPGADNESRVIRGKYTIEVEQQKAHGYLYGLS